MAVPEQTPYSEHAGNGSTTSFALGFQCETKDHLIVLVDDIEPPIATWSLTGGNVVFTTAPAAGKKITVQRNTPFSRTVDYQSYNNSLRPPVVNKDFDWIWWKLQELGVADWILGQRIDVLKNYVDRKDDELKAYLMEEIRKQGVALDQLDEYYNYLMQRLAQIAVDKGWDASFVVDGDKTQKQINDNQQEINNNQQNINSTLLDRTRLVDDYGADPEGLLDSASAFNDSLSASGYLNLRDGGVYVVKSALTRTGFLKVRGDAEIIFDFDGDGLLISAGNQPVDLGAVTYNGASHLGRKRRSVVRVNNPSEITANNHKIINVYNDTNSVMALYLWEYGDSELKNGIYKNITGLGNGITGDAIGAIRAVYGSGNTPCGDLKITGGHAENINTVDISGTPIHEDADAFATQTANIKASLIVKDVSYKNVGKRLVKTQTSADSLTSIDGCHGSSAWDSTDPDDATNSGMFSIASAYLGTLMFTKSSLIGGLCNYMIETSGNVDVIEFGNVFKPKFSARIKGAHTRPHLHSSASDSRIIHALSIVDNVARGSSTSSSTASQVDVANIIDHKVQGSELQLKNHVSLGNVLKGGGSSAAILYQYTIEQFTVSSNIVRDWQDGVYVRDGISVTKLAGAVVNNVTDNISRNLVSEFAPAAVGKVGVSGNYSTTPSSGLKYSMLAQTPTAPTLTAGSGAALPATPNGYISVTVNGNQRYIPIYA